jgi:hypothetical protein
MDVSTRQQMWKDMFGNTIEKGAELANTYDMPGSAPTPSRVKDKKTVIQKTAEVDLIKQAFEEAAPDDNEGEPVKGEQPPALPQAGVLKPKVDVSGQEPPVLVKKKEAQHYAVPSQGRFPLDGYDQVKKASAYFDEWHQDMSPVLKREFAANMVKRASALSIPTSDIARHYGGDKADRTQIKVAFDARRSVLHGAMDPLHELVAENVDVEVLDKLASAANVMDAESLAVCLTEFDRMTGLDHHWGGDVPDPYYSAFSKTAEEQESKTDPEDSIIVGNEYITTRKLVEFSKLRQTRVQERFGQDFATEFAKDPKGIFSSLPRDQKLVIMRMTTTSDSDTEGASAS